MASSDEYRIVLAGGGTGGHVYPTLAVAEAIAKYFKDLKLGFHFMRIGPRDGYGKLFEYYGIVDAPIASGKIRSYASIDNLLDLPKFFIGFFQALIKLYFFMPDAIFSKGGTGALPVVVAGWFYRIPIIIHESDVIPGRTNRASARFAKKIFVSFQEAARYFNPKKTMVTGNPVRNALLANRTTKELAKETLGFKSSDPLLIVIGGSQGARRINLFILENLGEIVKMTQVLHQAGTANLAETQRLARAATIDQSFRNRYQAVGFFGDNSGDDTMGTVLTAADLAISRPGSGSIFELALFGLPSILIPILESANDHQRANAYAYAETGAAIVIEESNLLDTLFLRELRSLLEDGARRGAMSAAASRFATPEAADKIAVEILALLR